jgi:single-strand DNA-binding protein
VAALGINKVILAGNAGKDPEIRYIEGGIVKATFPLATTEYSKDKNGNRVEHTEWHTIVLWRAQAEYAEKYLKKGNAVLIEGKLRTRHWEDKDKNKRYVTEVFADSINILIGGPKKEEAAEVQPKIESQQLQKSDDSTSQT